MAQSAAQNETEKVRCVGCRQMGPPEDLERFVYHESVGLMFDMRGGAKGKSAWIHALPGCIGPACWAGFGRVFGPSFDAPEADEILADLRTGVGRRLRERIAESFRLGEIAAGVSEVRRGLRSAELELVLVDSGAGERLRGMFSDEPGTNVLHDLPKGPIEGALGDGICVAGFRAGPRAMEIGRDAEKWICLEEDVGDRKRG